MILCLYVCFLLPWKSRHRVRLVGHIELVSLTIPVNLIRLRIIQSTSSRVCELANHRVTVKWKEFHLVHPSNPYPNPNLTPVHGNRKGI